MSAFQADVQEIVSGLTAADRAALTGLIAAVLTTHAARHGNDIATSARTLRNG